MLQILRAAGRLFGAGLVAGTLGTIPSVRAIDSLDATKPPSIDPFCTSPSELFLVGRTNWQGAGTRRMVERLAVLRAEATQRPDQAGFMSDELAEHYHQALTAAVRSNNFERALALQPQYALQLLHAGKSESALRTLTGFEQNLRQFGQKPHPEFQRQIDLLRAVCHLRIAEQENCLTNHTSESCLMPIQAGGVHVSSRGGRGAIDTLLDMLAKSKDDLAARWLLNLTFMTLGEYPGKVPGEHLIPPAVFASEYDIKRFPEIAGNVGLAVDDLAGGAIAEDFDNDGDLDLMASSWGLRGQLRFFRNEGSGAFSERTAEAGLAGLVSGLHIVQTDYNNDGWADVFVPRGGWLGASGKHPNSLLRNNGDGTFEDVTEAAGLLSFHPTQTAVWADFDGDGWLDLFIGNESSPERHPCELYRNNGDGTFSECAEEAGVAVTGFFKGVTSGDFNNDGRPDLYLSDRAGWNRLLQNEGKRDGACRFTDVTAKAGVASPEKSFPAWSWDFDNDGWEDIMVTGYDIRNVSDVAADYLGLPSQGQRARLYRNNGDGTFADVTEAAGLNKVLHAMGANFGDLDNDGWLDFYVGTGDPNLSTLIPNRMFRNSGGGRFQDVTTSGGFGHIQKGHGISFADLDNDGDQDVYIVMGGAFSGDHYRNALFQNPGHGNRWLTLKLEGVQSNRAAIGARIRVLVQTPEGERTIFRTVGTGASFGANPLRQEIGLGAALAIRSVEIRWPSGNGARQVLTGLVPNRCYSIREGAQTAVAWKASRL